VLPAGLTITLSQMIFDVWQRRKQLVTSLINYKACMTIDAHGFFAHCCSTLDDCDIPVTISLSHAV
jgi:hypothetical protein